MTAENEHEGGCSCDAALACVLPATAGGLEDGRDAHVAEHMVRFAASAVANAAVLRRVPVAEILGEILDQIPAASERSRP
jgi:hypothetical protein